MSENEFGGAFSSKAAPDATGAVLSSHISDKHLDPHPQYPLGTKVTTDIAAAIATHVALADPHTVYRLKSTLIARSDLSPELRETTVTGRVTPAAIRSTASLTNVDWPITDVLTVNITKEAGAAASSLVIEVFGSAYHDTAGGVIYFGVSCSGTDYTNGFMLFQNANTHTFFMGYERITGLAAGSYNVTIRARTAAGNLSCDTNDRWQMIAREVPA